jgi:peptidoglycan/LPS O-acetylase OafA/YrhL
LLLSVINLKAPAYLKPLAMAGTISYGIYLWHSVIFRALNVYAVTIDPFLTIVIVLSVSALSWIVIEQPMIKWSKRLCP